MSDPFIPGYVLQSGSTLDRALLVKFLHRCYQDLSSEQQDLSHLAWTVEQYFSSQTPLWWVEPVGVQQKAASWPALASVHNPVACLWVGNAVDQEQGDRHACIFLLYVVPEHRRQGLGTALVHVAESWAKERGDRQLGLQVFLNNQPALSLYKSLGFHAQAVWMVKLLNG